VSTRKNEKKLGEKTAGQGIEERHSVPALCPVNWSKSGSEQASLLFLYPV
jgi:hypothetical protein